MKTLYNFENSNPGQIHVAFAYIYKTGTDLLVVPV